MPNYDFSESFLELAYRAVAYSNCKTEEEKRHFEMLCNICDKFEVPVKKYLDMLNEMTELLKEFNSDNTV